MEKIERILNVLRDIETDIMTKIAEFLAEAATDHKTDQWRNVSRFALDASALFDALNTRGDGAPGNVLREYAAFQRALWRIERISGSFVIGFNLTRWMDEYAELLDAEAEAADDAAFEPVQEPEAPVRE